MHCLSKQLYGGSAWNQQLGQSKVISPGQHMVTCPLFSFPLLRKAFQKLHPRNSIAWANPYREHAVLLRVEGRPEIKPQMLKTERRASSPSCQLWQGPLQGSAEQHLDPDSPPHPPQEMPGTKYPGNRAHGNPLCFYILHFNQVHVPPPEICGAMTCGGFHRGALSVGQVAWGSSQNIRESQPAGRKPHSPGANTAHVRGRP